MVPKGKYVERLSQVQGWAGQDKRLHWSVERAGIGVQVVPSATFVVRAWTSVGLGCCSTVTRPLVTTNKALVGNLQNRALGSKGLWGVILNDSLLKPVVTEVRIFLSILHLRIVDPIVANLKKLDAHDFRVSELFDRHFVLQPFFCTSFPPSSQYLISLRYFRPTCPSKAYFEI